MTVKGFHFINGRYIAGVEPVDVSVVIPCYNEADGIEPLLREWNETLTAEISSFEIVVINDGSTDGTGRILDRLRKEMPHLRVTHQLNAGTSAAVRRGYEMAKGHYLLQVDATGRFEPSDFLRMWEVRHYSLVLANRTHRLDSLTQRLTSLAFRKWTQILFGTPFHDPNVSFRLFRRDVASRYYSLLPVATESLNLGLGVLIYYHFPEATTEINVPFRRRTHGHSHTGFLDRLTRGITLAVELLRLRLAVLAKLPNTKTLVPSPIQS